jgi:uncharacterized protein YjcR
VAKPDVVDVAEIAQRLGVKQSTVHVWRYRNLLPEPDWTISGQPAWQWATVKRWAKKTGRLPEEET